jgi:hypothetical protein
MPRKLVRYRVAVERTYKDVTVHEVFAEDEAEAKRAAKLEAEEAPFESEQEFESLKPIECDFLSED